MNDSSFASRHFAESVLAQLREAGFQAVFAGGCVRDLLLGRRPQDFDVATNAAPELVRNLFGHRRTAAVGASFGVVLVLPPHRQRKQGVPSVEVATFRREGDYRDGRHPARVEFATPEEDARRRDFTINGMFLDPIEDRILDFVGGFDDLHQGWIRAIGDPRIRMAEDKLRLLRAIRFAAAFRFDIVPETSAAIRAMAGELVIVSAERIAQELRRMLTDPTRLQAVELCREHGVMEVIFPELSAEVERGRDDDFLYWEILRRRLAALGEASFELAMAALLAPPRPLEPGRAFREWRAPAALSRLRLSGAEQDRIEWLLDQYGRLDHFEQMPLAEIKRLAIHPGIAELLSLERARAAATGSPLEPIDAFAGYLAETAPEMLDPPPLLTGGDLIHGGMSPGPAIGRILRRVRQAQLNEEISTRREALALAEELKTEQPPGTPMR